MADVSLRLEFARNALGRLDEALADPSPTTIVRDAAIQRFEFTFEAVWKAARAVLKAAEGVEAQSPKSAVRRSFEAGIISEDDARSALEMTDDRNLTVHTYNEALAQAIAAKLPAYAALFKRWLDALEQRGSEEK